jgi:hypothetical protein
MTDAEHALVLAMVSRAVEAVTSGDWERAEGWCAGAWGLCEHGRTQFIDDDNRSDAT